MANQVPYSPFPQGVEPTGPGNDYQNVNPNPAAFGGLVAGAEQQGGGQIAQGAESLIRAQMAKNDLTNELYANDATTNAMQGMADRYGDYAKLRGKAAVDAFPQYRADIQKLYQAAVDSAPNLASKAMLSRSMSYLHDSYQRYGQFQQDREFRSWQNTSAIKATDSWLNQAMMSINDLPQAQVFVNSAADQTLKLYEQNGYEIDQAEAAATQTRSKGYSQIIGALIAQGPAGAAKASEFFDSVKTQMDAPTVESVDKALKGIKEQQTVNDAVTKAIQGTGTSPTASVGNDFATTMALKEGGGKQPSELQPKYLGGPAGTYQVDLPTAKAWGINYNDLTDNSPEAVARVKAGVQHGWAMEADQFTKDIGRAPTPAEQSLMHQQGVGGAEALITHPNDNVLDVLRPYYKDGTTTIAAVTKNGGTPNMTAGQFADHVKGYYGLPDQASGQTTATGQAANDTLQPDRAQAMQNLINLNLPPDQFDKAKTAITQHYDALDIANAANDKAKKQAADASMSRYQNAMYDYADNPGKVPAPDWNKIENDPSLTPEDVRTLRGVYKETMLPSATDAESNKNVVAAFSRINLPEGDPNKITSMDQIRQLMADGKLKPAGFDWLSKQLTDGMTDSGRRLQPIISNFIDTAKQSIDRSFGSAQADLTGEAPMKTYAFSQMVMAKVAQWGQEKKDVSKLFDPTPGNKDYLGLLIPQYQGTMATTMRQMQSQAAAPQGGEQLPAGIPPGSTNLGRKSVKGKDVYRFVDAAGAVHLYEAP